jgi:hypothetical protein
MPSGPKITYGKRRPRGVCRYDGCNNPLCAEGFCRAHYRMAKRGLELDPIVPRPLKAKHRNEERLVGNYCLPHRTGLPRGLGASDFFVSGCLTCEQKKKDGKVTGNEPPPPDIKQLRERDGGRKRRLAMLRIKAANPGATL